MKRSAKTKGSAEAATSPSHGSNNPRQENAVNNSNDSTASAIDASTSQACPVLAMAPLLAHFRKVVHETMERRQGEESHGLRGNYLRHCQENAEDGEDAVRGLMLSLQATSLQGASIQLTIALSTFETLIGSIPQDSEDYSYARDRRAIIRTLFSARGVAEALAGFSMEDLIDREFASRHIDPWTPVDDRIAIVEASQ